MSHPLLTPPPTRLPLVPFARLVDEARAALPPDLPTDPHRLLVALDVDGTILRPDGASPRVRRAFHDLLDAGATVVVASGRDWGAAVPVFRYLGASDGWAVCSNGAVLARRDPAAPHGARVLRRHTFDPGPVVERFRAAIPGVRFAVERKGLGYLVSHPFPAGELISGWRLVPLPLLEATPTSKLVARDPAMDRNAFEDAVAGLGLQGAYEYAVGWTSWADVNPRGRTKATGLEELRARLGLPSSGTVAVGDGTNDVPMFAWAHHGVAMGGASAAVRARADAVTGPVEYDGAAAVMRALLER